MSQIEFNTVIPQPGKAEKSSRAEPSAVEARPVPVHPHPEMAAVQSATAMAVYPAAVVQAAPTSAANRVEAISAYSENGR